MKLLKFLRRRWHEIGLLSAIITGIYLTFAWNGLIFLQKLLILNFIVILLHQFEEYSWPGGFPAVMNMVIFQSEKPDRYPLNQNNSMVFNLILAYGFYGVPIFFPNIIWLGLAPVLVGSILQFIGHGIYINIKLKSFYNPGVAATIFGHIPVGIIYIYYIISNNLVNFWNWLFAVVYIAVFMFLDFYIIERKLLADKNSPYPFETDEMKLEGVDEET